MARTVHSRWAVLAVALLVESVGGLFYMFSVFSQTLKTAHWPGGASNGTLTQSQVDQVGNLANIGGNLAIHVGLLYDKFGPVIGQCIATLLGVIGWSGVWAALAFPSLGVPYYALLIFSFCQGNAQSSSDVVVIPTIAILFPKQRGMALGLAKSFVGLSGAIATRMYDGFFAPQIVHFMLFLTCEVAAIGMLSLWIFSGLNLKKDLVETVAQSKSASWRLTISLRIMSLLMLEMLVAALLSVSSNNESVGVQLVFAISMLVIFGILLVIVGTGQDQGRNVSGELIDSNEVLTGRVPEPDTQELKNFTPWEALRDFGFWLQFAAAMIGGGAGFVIINNITQMNLALGGNPSLNDVFVTIISICNCAGRLGAGAISDYFLHTWHVPRPSFFGIALMFMGLTHASLLVISSPGIMYVAATGAGLSFGAINCMQPIVASELYGNKHFGTIYTLVSLGFVPGSYLSAWLTGSVYDEHAVVHGDVKSCEGRSCFQLTELFCVVLCGMCSVGMFFLAAQSRERYRQLYHSSRTCS